VSGVDAGLEIEEIATTKSEKTLAVVLAVFLFIGGMWAYARVDDSVRAAVRVPAASGSDRAAIDAAALAQEQVVAAEERERRALEQLTLARETYRTALDAGHSAPGLERAYEGTRAAHTEAERDLAAVRSRLAAVAPAAAASEQRLAEAQRRALHRQALLGFVVRLLLVVAVLGCGYFLLGALRRRGSRFLPLGLAWVAFAAVLALVMAGDYVTDYVDPLDLGPLVLALVGIAFTLAAFTALQAYLRRRLPIKRVRKGECPFCGYPARSGGHCEGCGREVVGECASCARPRRVGTLHCGACGRA
jgi:hypothetical protein